MFIFTSEKKYEYLVLLFLVLIIILPRIPLLFMGYGSDGDSWRIARSASMLWNEGSYQPSRPPGFPVFEFLNAPFVGLGGSVYSNTFTLIVFIISVFLFGKILTITKTPSRNLILWTYALFPILWKNSTVTMDYIIGLTFILVSLLFILNKNYALSAIILGLAIGTRFTHILFLFQIFILVEGSDKPKKMLIFAIISLIISGFCYFPAISQDGYFEKTFKYFSEVHRYTVFQQAAAFLYRSIYTFGLLGSLSIVLFFFLSYKRIIELIKLKDKVLQFSIITVVMVLSTFLLMPDEREYLIPMIPFLLIIIGNTYKKMFATVTCCCLMSYAILNIDFIEHETGVRNVSPNISNGLIIRDYEIRYNIISLREKLPHLPLPDSSIVSTGMGPILWFENPYLVHTKELELKYNDEDAAESKVRSSNYFVYKLTYPVTQAYIQFGYHLYYLDDMKNYLESFLDYKLDSVGMKKLDIVQH